MGIFNRKGRKTEKEKNGGDEQKCVDIKKIDLNERRLNRREKLKRAR